MPKRAGATVGATYREIVVIVDLREIGVVLRAGRGGRRGILGENAKGIMGV